MFRGKTPDTLGVFGEIRRLFRLPQWRMAWLLGKHEGRAELEGCGINLREFQRETLI